MNTQKSFLLQILQKKLFDPLFEDKDIIPKRKQSEQDYLFSDSGVLIISPEKKQSICQ